MPHYEFECGACGHIHEEYMTMIEHDECKRVECPRCGIPMDPLIGRGSIAIVKGTENPTKN